MMKIKTSRQTWTKRTNKDQSFLSSLSFKFLGNVLSEEEVMTIINAADKDGDGHLDFEEFVKIMMAR